MAANLTALFDLCAQALAETHDRQRQAMREADAEAVKDAQHNAAITFGEEVAAAVSDWLPLDVMAVDTLQASARLTPHAYLRYSAHCDGDTWFELVAHCSGCGHDQELRVGSLEGLASAINEAGVRR